MKTTLTCAVTGNLTRPDQNANLPITPEQIAQASLEAAAAGAAIVHIHVRHPDGRPSMELTHYCDAVRLIRAKNDALILNLTTGPGGRYHPSDHDPAVAGPRTNFLPPLRRVEHIADLRPDVATLDLNTMTFGAETVINTPRNVRIMAEAIYDSGVKPEVELFDSGDIELMRDMLSDGSLRTPAMASLVLGVKYGFPANTETMLFARNRLPPEVAWTAFGIGRAAFPMLGQAYILGGNVRVGMEDTVYVERGRLTSSNAELVKKASWLITKLGGEIATSEEARDMLELRG
ncbi:MAG TPA: 3-keto-5-aminohexanoate cleavage protein [Roseiarcus sp.]|nr:3-keto-5-aminohexanoate cleavage protein [Roseiarcus sp.]